MRELAGSRAAIKRQATRAAVTSVTGEKAMTKLSGHAGGALSLGQCRCRSCHPAGRSLVSRRGFLAGSAAAAIAVGAPLARPARAQTALAPDAALAQLM